MLEIKLYITEAPDLCLFWLVTILTQVSKLPVVNLQRICLTSVGRSSRIVREMKMKKKKKTAYS